MRPLTDEEKKTFLRQHYKIIGNHSAVKPCLWTKESIKTGGKKICYKEKFYKDLGIKSHRCLQCTCSLSFCNLGCIHCWRNTELTRGSEMKKSECDKSKEMIDEFILAQRSLLTGLGGVPHSEKYLKEAQEPKNVAISLSGEPFSYPLLSDLIGKFKKRDMTVFLVTNGTFPEKISSLENLPTQLYMSLSSNSEQMFLKNQNPAEKNLWKKINETLELLPEIKTRKVIRLTLIRDINMSDPEKYAELIKKAEPDFIEVKAWMAVGSSRLRLKYEQMPSHEEIRNFAEKISDLLGYKVRDEQAISRVVLLKKNS